MQEGDCDEDEDCKDDLVCGKNNCIKNYDFWWDASDDCCEKQKSKPRDISKIQNIVITTPDTLVGQNTECAPLLGDNQ